MKYQPFNLSGKTAIVTGGNGGIGFGMAKALAAAGAHVSIWGRNDKKNQQAVAELQNLGGKASAQVVDVSDKNAVLAAMQHDVETLGAIDVVVANAGIGTANRSFLSMDDDEYHKVLAINLDGVVYTLQTAAEQMIAQKTGGSMIVVSSLGATEGMAGQQHYAASKGAIISVMKSCAVEFARHQIRCNAILPGFIETDMTASIVNSEVHVKKVLSRVPARRWGNPDDFGGVTVYLASEASSYQTGSVTIIDGGFSIF